MSNKRILLLALILFWLGLEIAIIVMTGNTLGGDVWAYAKSAQVFCEAGRLMIPDRSPQSLLFLTVWGGLFAKVFGFSFVTLNVAALVLTVIGIIFFLLLLRQAAPGSSMALPLAVYLFNPIFFLVAGGYLTDAPFLSLIVIAMYFFVRAYRRESAAWALVGSLIAACAFLIRQYGILLVIAAVVPFLMPKIQLPRRKRAALIFATLAPTLITAGSFFLWLKFKHGVPSEFRVYQLEFLNVPRILWSVLGVPFFGGLYMGLFLSPLALKGGVERSREEKRLRVFYLLVLAVVAVILAARGQPLPYMWNNVMPYWGSVYLPPAGPTYWTFITAWCIIGAGALFAGVTVWLLEAFRSRARAWDEGRRSRNLFYVRASLYFTLAILLVLVSGLARYPLIKLGQWIVTWIYNHLGGASGRHTFPLSYWIDQIPALYHHVVPAVSLILLLAGSGLLYAYLAARKEKRKVVEALPTPQFDSLDCDRIMMIALLVISVLFLILFWTRFDRYLLILLPPAILLLHARKVRPGRQSLSTVLMILLAAVAITNAHMGVVRSKKLWEGGQYLLSQGIPPERIRGSHGFNAWYLYDLRGTRKPDDPIEWWVIGDDYVVDRNPWPGYEIIRTFPYWNYFRLSQETVYVMKRMKATTDERRPASLQSSDGQSGIGFRLGAVP